jgi:hypothetical protein
MQFSTNLLIKDLRLYSQLMASIIKSSYFGIIVYLVTILFSQKSNLRVNSIFIAFIIFFLPLIYFYPLLFDHSSSAISFLKTLFLWMLPIFYYAFSSRDLDTKMFEKLLLLMMIYTLIEFILINFTSISLYDSDRLRNGSIFGGIRSEGVSHNSSISSALIVSIFLRVYIKKGLSLKLLIVSLVPIILLASGAGFLLYAFAILFFVFDRKMLLYFILSFGLLLILLKNNSQFFDFLLNIHPKISYEYLSFLLDLKIGQLNGYLEGIFDVQSLQNSNYLWFGQTIMNNKVSTSGDFGIFTMIEALGVPISMLIVFVLILMFIRASTFGNFAPFLILMIENIHYPIFVDPISAYVLAQYAIAKKNEI